MKTLKVNKQWFRTSGESAQTFLLSIGSSVITEDIIPWLTSFNNISFKESKTEEYVKTWFLDFGAKDMLIGIEAKTYQGSATSFDVMIHLYRKNFEKISGPFFYNSFYLFNYSDLVATSTTGGTYFRLSKNFFTITKENNLIALFQGGSYDLPDGKNYIVFDEDNFGEKYIMLYGNLSIAGNKDAVILYFNNEVPIFYTGITDIQKYSKENYLIAKKMKINYYPAYQDFYALSTNILNIDNINLETDKNTAHKIIEVNGIKYRKIIYNLWIEDSED